MIEILRDWRYIVPLTALVAITIAAAVVGRSPRHDATASVGPASEPTATSAPQLGTPSPGDVLLDSRRRLDLAALRDALEAYRFRFGVYPSTGGAYQGVCANTGEALCAVKWIAPKLPASDGQTGYRYRSDGATYTLYSPISVPDGSDPCPDGIPPEVGGTGVFCISSIGGTR